MNEKVFIEKGIADAMKTCHTLYPEAFYVDRCIVDRRTGKILSPLCSDENAAWRFAALLIYTSYYSIDVPNFFDTDPVELP